MTRANSSPIAPAIADGWQTMAEQEQDQELIPAISPSTPSELPSTRQPATMDGRSSRRSHDEIRRDLATEEGRGALTRQSPTGRLVADVPSLLAENERLRDALRQETARWELACRMLGERTSDLGRLDREQTKLAMQFAAVSVERDALRAELAAAGRVAQAVEAPGRLEDVIAAALCAQEESADAEGETAWWGWSTDDLCVLVARSVRAAFAGPGSTSEPATCEHGLTVPHVDKSFLVDGEIRCPGPTDDERPARPVSNPLAKRERATVALDGSAGPPGYAERSTCNGIDPAYPGQRCTKAKYHDSPCFEDERSGR
jgi:hypothetical protein